MFNLSPGGAGVEEKTGTSDVGEHWTAYVHRFNSLSVAAVAITNPTIQIHPDEMARTAKDAYDNAGHQPSLHMTPLVLGLQELSHLHIYISYKEKVIYVTAADAH